MRENGGGGRKADKLAWSVFSELENGSGGLSHTATQPRHRWEDEQWKTVGASVLI
jgi:hypothetical protein